MRRTEKFAMQSASAIGRCSPLNKFTEIRSQLSMPQADQAAMRIFRAAMASSPINAVSCSAFMLLTAARFTLSIQKRRQLVSFIPVAKARNSASFRMQSGK